MKYFDALVFRDSDGHAFLSSSSEQTTEDLLAGANGLFVQVSTFFYVFNSRARGDQLRCFRNLKHDHSHCFSGMGNINLTVHSTLPTIEMVTCNAGGGVQKHSQTLRLDSHDRVRRHADTLRTASNARSGTHPGRDTRALILHTQRF